MLDVMVAADQGCGWSEMLFRREVGIWKTTVERKENKFMSFSAVCDLCSNQQLRAVSGTL